MSSSMGSRRPQPQTGAMATVTKGLFQKSLRDIITGIRANKDRQKDYMNKCLQDIRAEVRFLSALLLSNAPDYTRTSGALSDECYRARRGAAPCGPPAGYTPRRYVARVGYCHGAYVVVPDDLDSPGPRFRLARRDPANHRPITDHLSSRSFPSSPTTTHHPPGHLSRHPHQSRCD